MNITFMVGNGFDIAAGVDTSYRSFYRWYCAQPSAMPHIGKFKSQIKEDIDSGGKYWSDFEVGLGQYTSEFSLETAGLFLDCYEDAQQRISEYLINVCKRYSYKPEKNDIAKAKAALSNFYLGTSPAEQKVFQRIIDGDRGSNSEIHIVSFNYTDVLDRYVKMLSDGFLQNWKYGSADRFLKINPSIIHAHGFTNLFPIIGVNDESQIINQELLHSPDFANMLIKAKSVASVGQLWHEQAETIISQSQIVCIFGMSLGSTDAKWWRKLVEWLKTNSDRHIIIFWHSNDIVNTISVRARIETRQKLTDKIMSYSNVDETLKHALSQQIHVCINDEKIFPMKLVQVEKNKDAVAATTKESDILL